MADHPTDEIESAPTPVRRPRVRQRPRTPQEARQWRRRLLGYAVAAVSFILVVNALVGENGYLATMQARHKEAELTREILRLNAETEALRERIQRLRQDPATLEEEARRLGLRKPGETVVIIKDPEKTKAPAQTPAPSQPGR